MIAGELGLKWVVPIAKYPLLGCARCPTEIGVVLGCLAPGNLVPALSARSFFGNVLCEFMGNVFMLRQPS